MGHGWFISSIVALGVVSGCGFTNGSVSAEGQVECDEGRLRYALKVRAPAGTSLKLKFFGSNLADDQWKRIKDPLESNAVVPASGLIDIFQPLLSPLLERAYVEFQQGIHRQTIEVKPVPFASPSLEMRVPIGEGFFYLSRTNEADPIAVPAVRPTRIGPGTYKATLPFCINKKRPAPGFSIEQADVYQSVVVVDLARIALQPNLQLHRGYYRVDDMPDARINLPIESRAEWVDGFDVLTIPAMKFALNDLRSPESQVAPTGRRAIFLDRGAMGEVIKTVIISRIRDIGFADVSAIATLSPILGPVIKTCSYLAGMRNYRVLKRQMMYVVSLRDRVSSELVAQKTFATNPGDCAISLHREVYNEVDEEFGRLDQDAVEGWLAGFVDK